MQTLDFAITKERKTICKCRKQMNPPPGKTHTSGRGVPTQSPALGQGLLMSSFKPS